MQALGLWPGQLAGSRAATTRLLAVSSIRQGLFKCLGSQNRNFTSVIRPRIRPCASSAPPFVSRLPHQSPTSSFAQPFLRSLHSGPLRHTSFLPSARSFLSFRPISSFFKPTPTPSPATVVRISRLEAEANANPSNVTKQVLLLQALIDTNFKEAYNRILTRWERTCEFDPTSPLIRSDDAFQLYLTALTRCNLEKSIPLAVARREQLLALPLPETQTTENATPAQPPSKSQQIAEAVLADPVNQHSLLGSLATSSARMSTPPLTSASPSAVSGTDVPFGQGVKGNPVHVVVEEAKGYVMWRLARFLLVAALYGFVALTIMSLLLENSGLLKAGPTASEFEPVQGKTVKFSDVHGVDEAKEELQDVVEFLKDPTSFSTLGGRLPKGVLLTGPPGTGKTMLAKAVAGEAGVPFFFASGSEFDEVFVGVGAKRIRELFGAARKKQPSIIFIDELDAIGSKRSSKDQHYMKQTLNQLLVELDGFSPSDGVIVIAATNFPQSLDQALVRPGRFDRKIAVPLPDVKGRVQILKHHMQGVVADADVDPMIIARGTPGFSGADLQNMVNQAAIQASKEGSRSVTLQHFEWAKDRIIMGSERKSSFIAEDVKRKTAYHEGGHALVALYTEGAMPLHKVTCIPRGHALGMTTLLPEGDRHSISYKEFLADIDVKMGGRVAEELIYGKENITSGASSDLEGASQTARHMVKHYGYSDKLGPVFFRDQDAAMLSPQKKDEIESEVRSLIEAGNARAKALLTEHAEELHRLANALVEYETLDLSEVRKVIAGEKIRGERERATAE